MISPITLARLAAWDAIESWPRLRDGQGKSVFRRKDRFEQTAAPDRKTIEAGFGPGDLPAITIIPADISVGFEVTRTQAWYLNLLISIWTPDWDLLTAEKHVPEVVNALYAATPSGVTVTFVETGTGFIPDSVPAIRFTFTGVGKDATIKAVRADLNCRLRFNFSPFEN